MSYQLGLNVPAYLPLKVSSRIRVGGIEGMHENWQHFFNEAEKTLPAWKFDPFGETAATPNEPTMGFTLKPSTKGWYYEQAGQAYVVPEAFVPWLLLYGGITPETPMQVAIVRVRSAANKSSSRKDLEVGFLPVEVIEKLRSVPAVQKEGETLYPQNAIADCSLISLLGEDVPNDYLLEMKEWGYGRRYTAFHFKLPTPVFGMSAWLWNNSSSQARYGHLDVTLRFDQTKEAILASTRDFERAATEPGFLDPDDEECFAFSIEKEHEACREVVRDIRQCPWAYISAQELALIEKEAVRLTRRTNLATWATQFKNVEDLSLRTLEREVDRLVGHAHIRPQAWEDRYFTTIQDLGPQAEGPRYTMVGVSLALDKEGISVSFQPLHIRFSNMTETSYYFSVDRLQPRGEVRDAYRILMDLPTLNRVPAGQARTEVLEQLQQVLAGMQLLTVEGAINGISVESLRRLPHLSGVSEKELQKLLKIGAKAHKTPAEQLFSDAARAVKDKEK